MARVSFHGGHFGLPGKVERRDPPNPGGQEFGSLRLDGWSEPVYPENGAGEAGIHPDLTCDLHQEVDPAQILAVDKVGFEELPVNSRKGPLLRRVKAQFMGLSRVGQRRPVRCRLRKPFGEEPKGPSLVQEGLGHGQPGRVRRVEGRCAGRAQFQGPPAYRRCGDGGSWKRGTAFSLAFVLEVEKDKPGAGVHVVENHLEGRRTIGTGLHITRSPFRRDKWGIGGGDGDDLLARARPGPSGSAPGAREPGRVAEDRGLVGSGSTPAPLSCSSGVPSGIFRPQPFRVASPTPGSIMEFSENIAQLRPSATIAVSTLARKLRAEGRDILDLSAGEPDFPTPGWISEAGVEGIRAGKTRYTPAPGLPELRQAVAASMARLSHPDRVLDEQGVVVTSGAKQGLFQACFTLFGPGDEVLIASPYWTSYPEMVTLARAEPVFVAGSEDDGFRVTPELLEQARTPRTRGLILCSPSNPTGTVYALDELRALARWAREHNVVIISDEIYRHIYFGEGAEAGRPAPGLLELPPDETGPFVVVDGVSKAFAMTGWRIGYTVSSPELARRMSALQSHTTSNAATPSQMAALAALTRVEEAEAAVAEMTRAFRRRRDLVVRRFREHLPDLPVLEPGGAFYLFVRIDGSFDEATPGSEAWCSRVLEETGVAMVPGAAFGDDRYARLSYATSDEILEEAVRRLAAR